MPEISSNNKSLVKNTGFLYFRMLFVMFVSLFTTRIVLGALGSVDYGVFNVIAGFVALFTVLNNSLTIGTNRYYNYALGKGDSNRIQQVYNASLRIQLILIVILILSLELLGGWYLRTKMIIPENRVYVANILFQCSILSLVFVALKIPYSAAVIAHEKMDFFAIVSIIDAVAKLAIAYIISNVKVDKLALYGALISLISVLNFALYFIYCKKNLPILKLTKNCDINLLKSLFSFSGWSLLDPFSYLVRDQGSNMTLNLFFGPLVNAAYGIASQVSGAIAGFASNLSIAFRPQVIQSYSAGNFKRTKSLMICMSKVNFIIQILISIPLIFEMKYILSLWLGDGVPEFTVIFSILVLIVNSINSLNEPVSIVMSANGNIKKIKIISMFIICSIIPVGYILFKFGMPPYSIYLAMICLTIVNQIVSVIIMSEVFREVTFLEYIKIVFFPCFTFLFLSIIVPFVIVNYMQSSLLRVFVVFIFSILFSLPIAYFVCLSRSEKDWCKGYINSLIKR